MHRPWQPYSETCRFDRLQYSFVGRAESLADDFAALMERLRLPERDRKQFDHFERKTRPYAHAPQDRLLRLMHYYLGDDEHDLVSLVRRRYADDLAFGGYDFPQNSSVMPW